MSTSTVANLATTLASAETGLVAQLRAGTARLERVGEGLPAELARLQEAAQLARQRMSDAVATFRQTVADVATFAEQLSAELFAELVPDVMNEPVAAASVAPVAVETAQPTPALPALPADPFPAAEAPRHGRKPAGHEGARARINGRAKHKSKAGG